MVRAFRSELLKFRRWSVLAGSGVMILATAFIAYLTFHQITSGATGPELTPLIQAFPTSQGLITVVGQARSLIIVIALIMVTSNIAAEWSQGTVAKTVIYPQQSSAIHTTVGKQPWAVTIAGKRKRANQDRSKVFPRESGEHGGSSAATATPSRWPYKSPA
jgi:hypothetical protein